MQSLWDLSGPKPNQITLVLPQSNYTKPRTLRHTHARTHLKHQSSVFKSQLSQSTHSTTPPTQPPYILEGVRACGKAVPGRHSRLCQSNNVRRPGGPVQGHHHHKNACLRFCSFAFVVACSVSLSVPVFFYQSMGFMFGM